MHSKSHGKVTLKHKNQEKKDEYEKKEKEEVEDQEKEGEEKVCESENEEGTMDDEGGGGGGGGGEDVPAKATDTPRSKSIVLGKRVVESHVKEDANDSKRKKKKAVVVDVEEEGEENEDREKNEEDQGSEEVCESEDEEGDTSEEDEEIFKVPPSDSADNATSVKESLHQHVAKTKKSPAKATKLPVESHEEESHEEDNDKDSKRKKKAVDSDEDAEKKPSGENVKRKPFERVYTDNDELEILNGLFQYYHSNNGSEASNSKKTDFHEFMKNISHVNFSKGQLTDKVRRLKEKFMKDSKRVKEGKKLVFPRPHNCKAFELSRKIWGSSSDTLAGVANEVISNQTFSKGKGKKIVGLKAASKEEVEIDWSMYPDLGSSFESALNISQVWNKFLQKSFGKIGALKLNEFEEQWKTLREEEAKIFLKRVELMCEQIKQVGEVFNSGK